MRPGGIQGESSKHKHQTQYDGHLSDGWGAQYKGRCQPRNSQGKRIYSQTRQAVGHRIRRSGLLTLKRRRQLDRAVSTILNYTAWMEKALFTAEESQGFAPAFIKKLAAVKDNLEAVAVTLKMYSDNNKEHGTLQLMKHTMAQVDDAVKQFACIGKILDLEPSSVDS